MVKKYPRDGNDLKQSLSKLVNKDSVILYSVHLHGKFNTTTPNLITSQEYDFGFVVAIIMS